MLNAERFKKEINKLNNDFGLGDNIAHCETLGCRNCRFSNFNNSNDEIIFCSTRKVKWLLSDYKKPPVKLTRLEQEILEYLFKNKQYKFIVRERNGYLYAYINKPRKYDNSWQALTCMRSMSLFVDLFQFIQWEDSTPTSIEYVLKNCEVIEDAEE